MGLNDVGRNDMKATKMRYMTEERMWAGIGRLLAQPRDMELCGARIIAHTPSFAAAGEGHRRLYVQYRNSLGKVLRDAIEWWDSRTEVLKKELGSAKRARLENWREFPAGPASDPFVVALLRRTWIDCDVLNREGDVHQVAPESLLLQWVVDDNDISTAEILSAMPYWPIGLDRAGNWV